MTLYRCACFSRQTEYLLAGWALEECSATSRCRTAVFCIFSCPFQAPLFHACQRLPSHQNALLFSATATPPGCAHSASYATSAISYRGRQKDGQDGACCRRMNSCYDSNVVVRTAWNRCTWDTLRCCRWHAPAQQNAKLRGRLPAAVPHLFLHAARLLRLAFFSPPAAHSARPSPFFWFHGFAAVLHSTFCGIPGRYSCYVPWHGWTGRYS